MRCAEPNKFYESLYFDTPIIVSEGTYLSERVRQFNSGYVVDAMNDNSIDNFINGLTFKDINEKMESIKKVPKKDSVNINDEFFLKLKQVLK